MSASREKKMRQNPAEVKPSAPEQKKSMSTGAKRTIAIIATVLIVALVVFFYMINSGFFATHTVAAEVKGHQLSPAMVNYFYRGAYSQMASEVGEDLMGYMLDTTKPLDEQSCSLEGYTTWADYFLATGLNTASEYYSIYDEAMANGFELEEDYVEYIDSSIENLKLYALYNGLSDVNAYLAYTFGSGCTEENYREYMEVIYTAQNYSQYKQSQLTYTQDEIDAYYADHSADFDAVNYRAFSLAANETRTLEEAEALAKEMAEASKNNEDAFVEMATANSGENAEIYANSPEITIRDGYVYNSCPAEYRDWLFEEGRQIGDTTYVSYTSGEEKGFYVVYFLGEDDRSFNLPNVRHILLSVTNAADEETKQSIKAKAEELLATFQAGDTSEEAFAELAKTNSSDNAAAGGLYENVAPGQMVSSFEEWCFDESRQVGDTGIVESTYGYHIMFYCGEGDTTYLNYLVKNAMMTADYESWYISAAGVAFFELKPFGKRFVTL